MPHIGRPYPRAIHLDNYLWGFGFPLPLPLQFRMNFRIINTLADVCANTIREIESAEVSYLYTDVMCEWRWALPCPNAWEAVLQLQFNRKVQDFPWRWQIWRSGVLRNQTISLPTGLLYNAPALPGIPQWTNPGGVTDRIFWGNPIPGPVLWP